MKNLKTFEDFINENYSINESFGSNVYSKEFEELEKFIRSEVKISKDHFLQKISKMKRNPGYSVTFTTADGKWSNVYVYVTTDGNDITKPKSAQIVSHNDPRIVGDDDQVFYDKETVFGIQFHAYSESEPTYIEYYTNKLKNAPDNKRKSKIKIDPKKIKKLGKID